MTGAEALAEAIRALAAAGVPDAARDARVLLAHALEVERGRLTLIRTDPLPPVAMTRLEAAIAARAARQPVAQITGRRAFWGHEFRVTRDVLDPRPETERLVELALDAPVSRVLDLGTGTGAILLSILADCPGATGLGTDVSPAALEVARGNADALGLADRAAFVLSDWWQGVTGSFDLIVSNPPYIAADEMAGLAPEVRDWEPHLALTPGGDGLNAYRAIAAGALAHLAPGGRLMIEIGPTQAEAVCAIFRGAGLDAPAVHADLDGRDRVIAVRRPQP
ncbi:MAG: peptide chain release factor N(5)-glutamine methyltransferase [Paracoccaceae bacterium]